MGESAETRSAAFMRGLLEGETRMREAVQPQIDTLKQQLAALTLRVEALEEREVGEFDDLIVPMLPPGSRFWIDYGMYVDLDAAAAQQGASARSFQEALEEIGADDDLCDCDECASKRGDVLLGHTVCKSDAKRTV